MSLGAPAGGGVVDEEKAGELVAAEARLDIGDGNVPRSLERRRG
jgi:hypothetical protein